jgi:hypothetical protein
MNEQLTLPLEESLVLVHVMQLYGRSGDIECLFVTTQERLAKAKGFDIMLGEVLGKHSDISIEMDDDNTRIVSYDQEKIKWLQSLRMFGDRKDVSILPIGWNLVEYAEEQMAESDDPDDEDC